jgi:magnesium transporter
MLIAFIKFADGSVSTATDHDTLNRALRDPGARLWLDLCKPTDDEYAILDDVFGFHPLAIEDVIQSVQRPKIESYNHVGDAHKEGYFFMVIHGPDLATFKQHLRTKELDLFVSERYLVTINEEPMKSIQEVIARAKSDPHMVLDQGIDMLLHNILDHLVDHYSPILDYLGDELDELEDEAAGHPGTSFLSRAASRKRELLNLRRVIGPQRDVLAQLTRGEEPVSGCSARE